MNKKKILNDPVYGFITIYNDLIYDIIEHPYFQRLRRIKQLGLTELVYPGAHHTRFHHAIGAMHLMQRTLDNLRAKGVMIFETEYEAALIAILLHDIGHGPFSHTLEFSLFKGVNHEQISLWLFDKLNKEFNGRLELAKQVFTGTYQRKFLHQLVSSQLDVDRLDYLKRDSFFTGVHEGTIGADRIIQMLNVYEGQLVVEEKGIYSIENFLNARRLMYWQVYLHKTSVAAETMLLALLKRAKKLTQKGKNIPATPALNIFLERDITREDFFEDQDLLEIFTRLDDTDIWGSIKQWLFHEDDILSQLSNDLLSRRLNKIILSSDKPDKALIADITAKLEKAGVAKKDLKYYLQTGTISNAAYIVQNQSINILMKDDSIMDVAKASDLPNIKAISKIVTKHYISYPKHLI
ncbi:HD domain-containing protein [Marinoscillum sp. MHG1-6]|uniref:HD domain-containing protein n=1 Tax=Marinoscillum sp. MHG1-6 TaxID=2959627 RepID=UPI002157F8AC|nr:HD domain-containing protein [Marinoscillum sp. MHG1-6]